MKPTIRILPFLLACPIFAQSTQEFEAILRGGARGGARGGPGECYIRVRIDDRAEIELRGARIRVNTLQGAPSYNDGSWCSEAMPADPRGFNFRKTRGRGNVDLISSPEGPGRTARIRVVDDRGGADTYEMVLSWDGGAGGGGGWESTNPGGGWGGGGTSGRGEATFPAEVRRAAVNLRSRDAEIVVDLAGSMPNLRFTGPVRRNDRDYLEVDLRDCFTGTSSTRCSGSARIRGYNGQVDSLEIDGSSNAGPFRVRFRR